MRLLGPVQVVRAGREIGLGGPRPRAVLALLVLEAGRVVPPDRLMILFSLSPRPVPVKCDRTRFGGLVPARTGSPSRAAHGGLQVMRSHEAVKTASGISPRQATRR